MLSYSESFKDTNKMPLVRAVRLIEFVSILFLPSNEYENEIIKGVMN